MVDPPSTPDRGEEQEKSVDDTRGDPGKPAREFGISWLLGMAQDSLEPGYAEAVARRTRFSQGSAVGAEVPTVRSRSSAVLRLGVALVLAGLSVGIAVGWRQLTAPADAKAQSGVLQDVRSAQSRQDALGSRADRLETQIRSQQVLAGAGGPLRSVSVQRDQAGMTAVSGPGLVLVIDQPTDTTSIQDRDVQFLVNGLWEAGAEAISVGGVRLRSTSAIRQAGQAILVDNRPVLWPISIDAIGNAADLQVALAATAGYGRMISLKSNYGAKFTVTSADQLELAGAGNTELRYARVMTTSRTPVPTGPEPTR